MEGPNVRDQTMSDGRSKRAWTNCVLYIPVEVQMNAGYVHATHA